MALSSKNRASYETWRKEMRSQIETQLNATAPTAHTDGGAASSGGWRRALESSEAAAAAREAQWEQRQLGFERAVARMQREHAQMGANLESLGGRVAEHALASEIAPLKEAIEAHASRFCERSELVELEGRFGAMMVPSDEVEALRRSVTVCSDAYEVLNDTVQAQLDLKAPTDALKRLSAEVDRLRSEVERKMDTAHANVLLEAKAERKLVSQLSEAAARDSAALKAVTTKVDGRSAAHDGMQHEAREALEIARGAAVSLEQLQGACEQQWAAARTGREEQAQIVQARIVSSIMQLNELRGRE